MSITPKAIQDLLDELEASRQARRLDEVRAGANLLRTVADLCKRRSRALHKFADAKESLVTIEEG